MVVNSLVIVCAFLLKGCDIVWSAIDFTAKCQLYYDSSDKDIRSTSLCLLCTFNNVAAQERMYGVLSQHNKVAQDPLLIALLHYSSKP